MLGINRACAIVGIRVPGTLELMVVSRLQMQARQHAHGEKRLWWQCSLVEPFSTGSHSSFDSLPNYEILTVENRF